MLVIHVCCRLVDHKYCRRFVPYLLAAIMVVNIALVVLCFAGLLLVCAQPLIIK